MKRLLFILLFLSSMLPAAYSLTSAEAGQFDKANLAYREGKFDEASALYKFLSEKYPGNSAFQYNYGNALHRKGEIGTAILAYERARMASPRNADILYNLNFVRALSEYRIEDKRNELLRLTEKLLGYFTLNELVIAALGTLFIFLMVWAWALFFREDPSWGLFRKMLLWIALIFISAALRKGIMMNFYREAIVVAKQAQVYYGPSVTDQQAFRLGDGLKALVVDDREGWSRILIASGESGWIQKDQIAEVRRRR